jgi:hypothetical protein
MYKVDHIRLRWPGPQYEVIFVNEGGLQQTIAFFWKKTQAEEYANFKNESL